MKIDLPKRNILFQAGIFAGLSYFYGVYFPCSVANLCLTLCGPGKKTDVTLLLSFTLFQ